ncbi:hypothetical protein PPE03_40060 [Pseudoalteromonas peptidolytica]|nr:hypothetical protein PPE03_40060 [Pseudoalteromonas peptidolytica]
MAVSAAGNNNPWINLINNSPENESTDAKARLLNASNSIVHFKIFKGLDLASIKP